MESYLNPWSLIQKLLWDPLLCGNHFGCIEYMCQRFKKKKKVTMDAPVSLQGKNNDYENKSLHMVLMAKICRCMSLTSWQRCDWK